MTGKLLAGTAGIAMIVAASAASAADIPPLGAEAVMEPGGPKVSIVAEAAVLGIYSPGFGGGIIAVGGAGVDVRFSSGLGVSLTTQVIGIPTGPVYISITDGRVFYASGKFEAGLHLLASAELAPFVFGGFAAGSDFSYTAERFTVTNETLVTFFGGSYDGFTSTTEVTFDLNEKVEVLSSILVTSSPGFGADIGVDTQATITVAPRFQLVPSVMVSFDTMGPPGFGAGLEARFPLGAVTPYIAVGWSNGGGIGLEVGAELEKQIRTSPFTLFGRVAAAPDFSGLGNHQIIAGIGIRYETGDNPPDFFLNVFEEGL